MSRAELLQAGLTRHAVRRCVALGLLRPVHPGVYLIGVGLPPPLALESAALLACAPRAMLSGPTAARLWRLPMSPSQRIEVTLVGRHRRSPQGVRVRSIKAIARSELRRLHGLPLTSPSLTILDLAGVVRAQELAEILNEARVQRLVSNGTLAGVLRRHSQRRGARALRHLLETERGPRLTRSQAERRALELVRSYGLEPDETNYPIGPWNVDQLYRRERLVVEIDGHQFHSTPRRFVEDRRRMADLAARGYQVFPLTWHDLGDGAARAMERLLTTLGQRRAELHL